jgi:hypothetical protein
MIKNLFFLSFLSFYVGITAYAHARPLVKTKFYNFEDLLINGSYKKPQILYIDEKQKVKFERLLKLRKDFLQKLKMSRKDPSLH